MKRLIAIMFELIAVISASSQSLLTPFELSGGKQTATYFECISFYKRLDKTFNSILVKRFGMTDAGYPLHVVLFSADGAFDISRWKKEKVIILVNNGIHAGEPDGIDASMMLLRDLATGKVTAPKSVAIAFIPVYNVGGALNRNSYSRVNQQGPESYGFRANGQNLDLNRDFSKCDSYNARSFASIFHYLKPTIIIDNHVTDGADYQHTMTLLTTGHDKLGGPLGKFLHSTFEPGLFKRMKEKKDTMCPYVNFENAIPGKGWLGFYDPPRYSSGYVALFQTIGFVAETHMLKPFPKRVRSTYRLMVSMIEESSNHTKELITNKTKSEEALIQQTEFPLSWMVDSSRFDTIRFKGYEVGTKTSEVTGMPRLYYDHSKPYEMEVRYYDYYKGRNVISAPRSYIIPQAWNPVIEILKLNKVLMKPLLKDTTIEIEAYRIEDYKSLAVAYEGHHRNYDVVTSKRKQSIHFLKGDFVISCDQPAKRLLVEMLEPTADDSFFSWNFFDAVLQQKEGYSDYRWEEVAANFLRRNPEVKRLLEDKKKVDRGFAASAAAQLNFVYKNSPYYEPAHLRYPVYRLVK